METSTSVRSNRTSSAKPLITRNPKACQECRKRKVKCDAAVPCTRCRLKNTECTYRVVPRPRRRKRADGNQSPDRGGEFQNEIFEHHVEKQRGRSSSLANSNSGNPAGARGGVYYNSVAATHLASPSCELQVYYGPTSNFSMMQQIYRHLTSNFNAHSDNPTANGAESTERKAADGGEVEEAGPGLDMFGFRRIFFGDIEKAREKVFPGNDGVNGQLLMFLPYGLAEQFLNRYLLTVHHASPFLLPEEFRSLLNTAYAGTNPVVFESASFILLLLSLAIGAAMTDHGPWGDKLFQNAKVHAREFDDVINLQAVQVPLLMAHFQIENGKPNSALLYTGIATRKAISAGLHKGVNSKNDQPGKDLQGRTATIWVLYFYETWLCFIFGRRSSLLDNDISVPDPTEDYFVNALVQLSRIASNTASRIYGSNHCSLLSVWRAADQTYKELRCFSHKFFDHTNLEPYIPPEAGESGLKKAALMAPYCHTVLLTFRPFLVFRVKFKTSRINESSKGPSNSTTEIPQWLDDACEYALNAARYNVRYLAEGSELNELIRESRYHSFFLEGACFALVYDSLRFAGSDSPHLPWIKAALRCISTMIPTNDLNSQTTNVFTAIYRMFMAVCPGADLSLDDLQATNIQDRSRAEQIPLGNDPNLGNGVGNPGSFLFHQEQAADSREQSVSDIASQWGLPHITQSEEDWDFNFPTVDLESFLTINPTGTDEGSFGFAAPAFGF